MTYFISIEELKQNNVINANVDSEYIEPALREAQDIFLREIIGDTLYNTIENKINGNTLTGKYLTLVNQYIKPYLENRMLASLVVPISMKIRNAGVIQQFDQGFNSSNVKDVAYLADYYNGRVEFYENRMTEYLKKNINDIPEYAYSNQNVTNPSQTHTAGTIYLGGGRKRPCGANYGQSGGSVETVDWDNIQNRPDFAEVATSGDYNDLDNRPAIPTVSDATINIYQGGTLKGSFSLNQSSGESIQLDAGGGGGSTDWSDIQNKPNFATVATSGDYNDLQNKPTIPAPQVQADWQQNDSTQPDYIKHRPSMPSAQVQSDWNQTNTSEVDYIKNKPTIPAAQVQSDWNAVSGMGEILNKPNLATVATTGNYSDLNGTPTIPAAPVQSDWNENDNTSLAYIQNKPSIPAAQVQSDWNEADNTSKAYIANKPTIPAAQVQSDWNEADSNSKAYIQNKPSIPVVPSYTTETWTFTLQNNTTVTKTVYLVPSV